MSQPSAGSFVKQLNLSLVQGGYNPHVITFWRGEGPLPHPSSSNSITYTRAVGAMFRGGAPDWISSHWLQSMCMMPLNTLRLRTTYQRALKQKARPAQSQYPEQSDDLLTIAHWAFPCGWIARHQRPVIYCHGGDVALLESLKVGHIIAAQLARWARGVICVSEQLRRRWDILVSSGVAHRWYRSPYFRVAPSFTLPMGIELPQPCERAMINYMKLKANRYCIVTVGRLVPIKGYHLLVEALGELNTHVRDQICWLAAGQGSEESYLQNRAHELNVPLTLLGELKSSSRDALLQVADLFVAPSIQEGTRVEGAPLALREAALSGCPLLVTPLGGVRELIDLLPEDAVDLCEPQVQSIYKALCTILESAMNSSSGFLTSHPLARQLSEAARCAWSWEILGSQHSELIHKLTSIPHG